MKLRLAAPTWKRAGLAGRRGFGFAAQPVREVKDSVREALAEPAFASTRTLAFPQVARRTRRARAPGPVMLRPAVRRPWRPRVTNRFLTSFTRWLRWPVWTTTSFATIATR